jgi:uncharacterized protein with GYD domain
MPLYLIQASYRADGVKGLMKDGGTKRRAAVKQMLEAAGGKLHSLHFAFGESDVFAIGELPDQTTAAAVGLAINASGAVRVRTTVLITPEEVDAAAKKALTYKPPGSG